MNSLSLAGGPGLTRLHREPPVFRPIVAGIAGFSTYFAMYAFRKPVGAAHFAHVAGWDFALDYKSALLIAQLLGYALSKFIGIKIISEMEHSRRGIAIVALIVCAWLAMLGFALIPPPWNLAFLFLNGLPLGMIWGLVFSYMEGRRTSDALGAMLCASFIVSSGVVKSVGGWLLLQGVSEFWMPAMSGALFFPLLLLSVWVLSQLPPPDAADEAERTRRVPMSGTERAKFVSRHALLLALLVLSYLALTALRDFRDNFSAELWTAMGYAKDPGMFSASELPVGMLALLALGLVVVIRNNAHALRVIHALILAGAVLLAGSTLAFSYHLLSPLTWMIISGAGLFLAYTPFNAMLFDRLIASFGKPGNAGFLIYIGDTAGYAASALLLLYRSFAAPKIAWLSFYTGATYGVALLVGICALLSGWLILRKSEHAAV